LHVQTETARNDSGDIEHVFDKLGLRFCVSFDYFERPSRGDFIELFGAEDLDPDENCIQRSS